MILAIDIHYKENFARAVGILFDWEDKEPQKVIEAIIDEVEEYESGSFYKRELPCILALLEKIDLLELATIVIDGHVFVDNQQKYGLGGYLYTALDKQIPVIGVAKRSFHNTEKVSIPVCRGKSQNPLYVSAIGCDLEQAAHQIQEMKGEYRIPYFLKLVDSLGRK